MRLKPVITALALLAALGLIVFWVATGPVDLSQLAPLPPREADLKNGQLIYNVGGCISCHRPAEDSGIDLSLPAGGRALKTPIGKLYPPNLTPDPATGTARNEALFLVAMQRGLGAHGENLIPAFPYTSYARMRPDDLRDLWAYLQTLTPVKNQVPEHQVFGLPVIRRGLTLWKAIGFNPTAWQPDLAQSENWNRGGYLVNGPGHCPECHTPRNIFMASDSNRAFMGGPHPAGSGKVPSLHGLVERGRYKDLADLVSAFQSGELGGYEHMSSSGMGEVQTNLSKLPEAELRAIAEYVLSLK